VHVAVHAYMLTCGLLFWTGLVGRDPTGWRPSARTKSIMVTLGIPVYLALAAIVSSRDKPLGGLGSLSATHAAAWPLAVGGVTLTFAGLVLLAAQRTGARAGSRERWNARRMFAISSAMATQQAMARKR
jgi:hypothetical protein